MARRKICVITGTRAEYGILRPVMDEIKNTKGLTLQVVVTGMHMLKEHGLTINQIAKEGIHIDASFRMYDKLYGSIGKHLNPISLLPMFLSTTQKFKKVFCKIRPDVLLVLGDRLEPFLACIAARDLGIPIAHIHGGDKCSVLHIDEEIRWQITKLAHIHFPATRLSAKRIFNSGEDKWRVHVVGSPSIDSIRRINLLSRDEVYCILNIPNASPYCICIQHPVTAQMSKAGKFMGMTVAALKRNDIHSVLIYPSNDPGSSRIISVINRNAHNRFFRIFKTLPHREYLSALRYCSVVLGNSTSGIIDASYFRIPAVNIGPRNEDREHGLNRINVAHDENAISRGFRKAFYNRDFIARVKRSRSPYGDGHAAEKIADILLRTKIDGRLLGK